MYIAELHRIIKPSTYPLGTLGYMSIYMCDDKLIPYGEPVCEYCTLEPSIPVLPIGEHNLSLTYSPRFSPKSPYRKFLGVPLISSPDCPERRGIRIHIGNTVKDTRGCVLIGTEISQDGIINSRAAYVGFMKFASKINKIVVYESY